MRSLLITLIYLYSLTAQSTDLVVQSRAITDLYGRAYISAFDVKDVIILERQARQNDVAHAVSAYVKEQTITNVILLGQFYELKEQRHVPILTQFKLPDFIAKGPVYLLTGTSKLEQIRGAEIEKQAKVNASFTVKSEYDLRKAMASFRSLPTGYVIINLFSLRDNWGEKYSYKYIEDIVVSSRLKHLEVGVCYPGYKTALAVGPTIDDVQKVLKGESSTSVCASLDRLHSLDRMEVYSQQSGNFYHVNPDDD